MASRGAEGQQEPPAGSAVKDFNLKITVRSARVLAAINAKFGSQAAMARATGIGASKINSLVTMTTSPVGVHGWSDLAETCAAALGVYPSDLWPQHMQRVLLKRATADISLDMAEIEGVMSDNGSYALRELLGKASVRLTDRQIKAICMHVSGATLDDAAKELGMVSRERARQITMKGLRQMRKKMHAMGIHNFSEAMQDT